MTLKFFEFRLGILFGALAPRHGLISFPLPRNAFCAALLARGDAANAETGGLCFPFTGTEDMSDPDSMLPQALPQAGDRRVLLSRSPEERSGRGGVTT